MKNYNGLQQHVTEEHKKRLFIALPIERHFLKVFDRYRDTHGKIPYLRWMPMRKLHVTVLFLGNVGTERIPALNEMLSVLANQHAVFGLTLEKVQYAPPEKIADMVWAYLTPHPALDLLASAVYGGMLELGITPADSYKTGRSIVLPHITLARFNDKQVQELQDLHRTELEGHKMLVEEMQLIESKTHATGSEYTTLGTYELGTE